MTLSNLALPRPTRPAQILMAGGAMVFLLAVTLRLAFVDEVYQQWTGLSAADTLRDEISFLSPDSRSYLTSALAARSGRIWNAGTIARMPGYPLFLAALGVRYPLVLFAQAVLGAAMCVGIFALVHVLSGRTVLAVAAGALAALSPTGIGLSGMVLADLPMAILLTAAVLALVVAGRWRSPKVLVWAAAFLAAASMVKPSLLLFGPVAIGMLWAFAGGSLRPFRRGVLALFLGLQWTPMLAWSSRNAVVERTFVLSTVSAVTVRTYLMSRADAWATLGRDPDREERFAARQAARDEAGDMPLAERRRFYQVRTREIVRAHPVETVKAYLANVGENFRGGWAYFGTQLPARGLLYRLALKSARLEALARAAVPGMMLALLAVVAWRWRPSSPGPSRQLLLDAVAMIAFWGYFVVLGGIGFWGVPRLLYPTTCAVLSCAALLATAVSSYWPAAARR